MLLGKVILPKCRKSNKKGGNMQWMDCKIKLEEG
jgi:hypothetical protein